MNPENKPMPCPLGGVCDNIGWCDECPRFIGEEEDDE